MKKICVQPPYFALKNLKFDNKKIHADFTIEQSLISDNSVITGAEAGRHLAILGSCALALNTPDTKKKYYLATSARFHQHENFDTLASKDIFFSATATAEYLDKRIGRADTELFDKQGQKVLDLTVFYTIVPKPIFDRSNKDNYLNEEKLMLDKSPYADCLICDSDFFVSERKAVVNVGEVNKQWCEGHFPNYPAMPVAVLMYNLEYMADRLLKKYFSDENLKYCFSDAIINSDTLAFHGDDISFDVELIAHSENKCYFLAKVICNSTQLISTLNLTAQIL